MSEEQSTEPQLSVAAKLRRLADFIDEHPVLEQFPELFETDYFGRHYIGDETAQLDVFAEAFSVPISHTVHGPNTALPGSRYSTIWLEIDGLTFRPQAKTEDYEQATGKTVPLPPEEIERRLLAEVEHWSKTPMPGKDES